MGPYTNQPQSKSLGMHVFQQVGRAAGAGATGAGFAVASPVMDRVTIALMRLVNFITTIKLRALEVNVGQRQAEWEC